MDAPENCLPVMWDALPNETWVEIFSWLRIAELGIAARVCKRWEILASDEIQWKARFFAKWNSEKKTSESSWRSECKRFLYHVPSVETAIFEADNVVIHVSFSGNGEFFVSCTKTGKVSIYKTDTLQVLDEYEFEKTKPYLAEFNAACNLLLLACTVRFEQKSVLLVYSFDPTESAGSVLVLVDRWMPKFCPVPGTVSWLDNGHYLLGMDEGWNSCLIQVRSATRQRGVVASYSFQDIQCNMLLAAEIPGKGGGEKILIFPNSFILAQHCIFVKRMIDDEVDQRPSKPDHCISMEGLVMGIVLSTDKKTLIVTCRADNCPLYIDSNPCKVQILLVDLVTLRILPRRPLLGPVANKNVCSSLVVSSGTFTAYSSEDGFAHIFDTQHSCYVRRLAIRNQITALAWNPVDAEMLLSAAGKKISIWSSRNKKNNPKQKSKK